MSINGKAYIAGVYEHPTRKATDKSLAQLHAESALGALKDAGLTKDDVDGYFCAGDAPGLGPLSLVDYMGLKLKHLDATETGGSSYVLHVGHAAEAIAMGKCSVALITLAGRPRAEGMATGTAPRNYGSSAPDVAFEFPFGPTVVNMYAMCAQRHMYEYGTTSEQLAWIKVAASHHAQYNEHAMLKNVVTVDEVVNSPMIADPLHRLDCCVISDGGGAIIVTSPEVAKTLKRPLVKVIGAGEAPKHQMGGKVDLTYSGAVWSGPMAFDEAHVKPTDIKYASIIIDGKQLEYFKFITDDGYVDYFNREGKNVKKSILKTPLDGARISSNFGMRKHPISGFNKMHKGVDFAAPTGTPIYAGGNGIVEYVGRNGGYGKYIRIRHNNGYKTAYAHLSNYKKGISKGVRVNQGEVIGYVGSTGNSTGPHLHYEIIYQNKHINPLKLKLPSGKILEGKELEKFKKEYKIIYADHLSMLYE